MEPRFRLSRLGTQVLDVGSYTYYRNNRSRGVKSVWFCGKRKKGCRASLILAEDVIMAARHTHNHE